MANMDFDKIVQDYVLENGKALDLESSYYGWNDYNIDYHMEKSKNCDKFRIIGKVELVERSIEQFNGTFSEDNQEIGLELRGDLVCKCGQNKVSVVRLKGSFSEILLKIMEENKMVNRARVVNYYDNDYHYDNDDD